MYSIAQEDMSDITDKSHICTACMVSNDEKAKKKKTECEKNDPESQVAPPTTLLASSTPSSHSRLQN